MTAFGREECQVTNGLLTWEIRSVNHRYQETAMRLPEDLKGFEPMFRQAITNSIKRGRIDAVLRYQPHPSDFIAGGLDISLVQRLAHWDAEVRHVVTDVSPLSVAEILRWPGVLGSDSANFDQLGEHALKLLNATLRTVVSARESEGEKLANILQERLSVARELVLRAEKELPEVELFLRARLEGKISSLKQDLDPGRLEQELVLLLSKADVQEEIDRLFLHLEEVKRALSSKGPVGRRLDFLMQELHREANTMASKSAHSTMTSIGIDLKVVIEQMREQVQNLE